MEFSVPASPTRLDPSSHGYPPVCQHFQPCRPAGVTGVNVQPYLLQEGHRFSTGFGSGVAPPYLERYKEKKKVNYHPTSRVASCFADAPTSISTGVDSGSSCPIIALLKMFFAAFTSLSSTFPQLGQICVLTDRSFGTGNPQILQSADVPLATTKLVYFPASSALKATKFCS